MLGIVDYYKDGDTVQAMTALTLNRPFEFMLQLFFLPNDHKVRIPTPPTKKLAREGKHLVQS